MRTPSPRASAALLLLVASAALLPFTAHQLGPAVSFLPAMLAIVACFDLMSVYLLVGEYRDTGDRRILAMSWCYVWSLVVMSAYTLAFPGVVSPDPPLGLTPSMAPWFYIAWHGGFPLLLGLAWAPWPRAWSITTPVASRRRHAWASVSVTGLLAAAVVLLMSLFAHQLPVLIQGIDTTRMTLLTAPVTLPLTVVALVLAHRGTRGRQGPERWTVIVVLVCLCDLVLTYAARHRFTLGWYAGRTLTMVAAGIVLVAMLAVLRRAKSQAEHDAMVDLLTGLPNRRSAQRDLSLLVDVARLTRTPLAAISLDIDHFKQVNDSYGHEAGDLLLAELGRRLPSWLRQTDVAARVGGEEFLILLPDTDLAGAETVAEQVRSAMAAASWPGLPRPVTVSLGVSAITGESDDAAALLRRIDAALYAAKNSGRNRVRSTLLCAPQPRRPSADDRRVRA